MRSARAGPSTQVGWRQGKVFSQVFFKKLAGCGTASHGPKGVARTVGPAFPYFKKWGDVCPPLGTAQKPLPQGLREGNGRITPKTQETSHFYDLPTWANHYGKWSRHLYDSSTWSNHRTRIKPSFFDDSSIFSSQVGAGEMDLSLSRKKLGNMRLCEVATLSCSEGSIYRINLLK